jgi:crotonobetainyl-CoA:carnitine CoA-transferase CaiB-like acyl-CoA transferase
VDPTVATTSLLTGAWQALGGEGDLPAQVRFTPPPPDLLPSSLHALPAVVAAVGSSTLAAAVLDAVRSGSQVADVEVDPVHVALAAVSGRHARRDGEAAPAGDFAALSRFWRTADGWLRTHANYTWHRRRLLAVLGCPDDPDAVAAAVAELRGEQLEDALADAGALGYAVRTPQQWQAHPQGVAVAARPLLDVRTHGAARALPPGRFADGVRVLDLTRVIAGPVATRTLAAWGADVLRLDPPAWPESASTALDTLSGKRSADLDVTSPDGRQLLEQLLAQADVLVHGYRPGALARYGLDDQGLAERHPHLAVVQVSAWGPTGPWADRRGFDSIVQCPTGIAALEGDANSPGALPAQVLDHATGYLAAAAALLSLARSGTSGTSSAHLSLASTAHWLTSAGAAPRVPLRTLDPGPHSVRLRGPRGPVTVVEPPGRAGDRAPRWTATTDLSADPPGFGTADASSAVHVDPP